MAKVWKTTVRKKAFATNTKDLSTGTVMCYVAKLNYSENDIISRTWFE